MGEPSRELRTDLYGTIEPQHIDTDSPSKVIQHLLFALINAPGATFGVRAIRQRHFGDNRIKSSITVTVSMGGNSEHRIMTGP